MGVLDQVILPRSWLPGAQIIEPTTDSGWQTYSAGSRLFLPAETNIVPDTQGVLADGTFWPASTANTATTANQALPVTLPSQMGTVTKCVKYVNDGTADSASTANLTVVASTSYWSALYIYAPEVGGNITVTAENGHTFTLGTITGVNTQFVLYGLASPTVGGEVTLNFKVAFAGGTQSTIYITAASLLATTIQQPHFDGTYPNCAWTGTAHASTSTRTASLLTHGNTNSALPTQLPTSLKGATGLASQGTVAMRLVPLWGDDTIAHEFLSQGDGYFRLGIRRNTANAWACFPNGTRGSTSAAAVAIGVPQFLAMRWNAAAPTGDINANGVDATQNTAGGFDGSGFPITELAVGCKYAYTGTNPGDTYSNAYIGPVIISPQRKSDAWVTAIQEDSGRHYSDLRTLWSRFMSGGDLLIPLFQDGRAYLKRSGIGSQP